MRLSFVVKLANTIHPRTPTDSQSHDHNQTHSNACITTNKQGSQASQAAVYLLIPTPVLEHLRGSFDKISGALGKVSTVAIADSAQAMHDVTELVKEGDHVAMSQQSWLASGRSWEIGQHAVARHLATHGSDQSIKGQTVKQSVRESCHVLTSIKVILMLGKRDDESKANAKTTARARTGPKARDKDKKQETCMPDRFSK